MLLFPWHRLLGEHDQNGGGAHPSLTVTELIALFLDMVQAENSESTYYQYQRWLKEFAMLHGSQQARRINTVGIGDVLVLIDPNPRRVSTRVSPVKHAPASFDRLP